MCKVKVFSGWYNEVQNSNVDFAINICQESIKKWSNIKGYDYEFLTDTFLSIIPTEELKILMDNKLVHIGTLADYARLLHIIKYLDSGYSYAIWMDADIYLYNNFDLELLTDYSCIQELWIVLSKNLIPRWSVSNHQSYNYANGILLISSSDNGYKFVNNWVSYIKDAIHNNKIKNWISLGSNYLKLLSKSTKIPTINGLLTLRKNTALVLRSEGRKAYEEYLEVANKAWSDKFNSKVSFINLSPNANMKYLHELIDIIGE